MLETMTPHQTIDLDLLSAKALAAIDLAGSLAALTAVIDETVAHLKTGMAIEDAKLPQSLPDRDTYASYLNAFRMELTITGLWDLHNVLRGSPDPFRISRAASEAEDRLALLHDRLQIADVANE